MVSIALPQSVDLSRVRAVYKVILLGSYGAGKTSIFWRVKTGEFLYTDTEETPNGIADRCLKSYTMDNGDIVLLDLWDTAGMERVRGTLTRSYYRDAHLAALVYDVSNVESLFRLREWINDTNINSPEARFVLIGNKYDKPPDMTEDMPEAFAREYNIETHFKVSTKESSEVANVFQRLVCDLHQMKNRAGSFQLVPTPTQESTQLLPDGSNTRNKCC